MIAHARVARPRVGDDDEGSDPGAGEASSDARHRPGSGRNSSGQVRPTYPATDISRFTWLTNLCTCPVHQSSGLRTTPAHRQRRSVLPVRVHDPARVTPDEPDLERTPVVLLLKRRYDRTRDQHLTRRVSHHPNRSSFPVTTQRVDSGASVPEESDGQHRRRQASACRARLQRTT